MSSQKEQAPVPMTMGNGPMKMAFAAVSVAIVYLMRKRIEKPIA